MTPQDCNLSSDFLRIAQSTTLWKGEKGLVEVNEDVPVIQVTQDDEVNGYVFGGKGRLVVDTIVETTKGAIGNPTERDINDPFLMLGNTDSVRESLEPLKEEEFTSLETMTKEEFRDKAQNLLDQFLGDSSRRIGLSSFSRGDGFVFAFPNDDGKLDILLCKDSKMVYTGTDKVFVSKGDKEVLTSFGDVVVSKSGKSVCVSKGECLGLHIRKSRT